MALYTEPETATKRAVSSGLPTSEKLLVSKKETAQILSVSPRTVDNLIANKELMVRRVGKRVLIPRTSLESFARRDHRTRPSANEQVD